MSSAFIRTLTVIFCFILFAVSCTNRFHKGLRTGKWKFEMDLDSLKYTYSGRFKKGVEHGTWKYYMGKQLTRKEKYKRGVGEVWFYHPNGVVESHGMTRFIRSENEAQWYYYGDWEVFDENGKKTSLRNYDKGKLVWERKVP